jgi:hypothetical protein
MRPSRWVALPVLAAALALSAGTLYAASRPTRTFLPFGTSFWSAVAKKVGVSSAKLEAAVEAELKTTGGHAFPGAGGAPTGGSYPHGSYAGGSFATSDAGAIGNYVIATAAKYLGLSEATLTADIAKGKSIDAVATALKKSTSGLAAAEDKALTSVLGAK